MQRLRPPLAVSHDLDRQLGEAIRKFGTEKTMAATGGKSLAGDFRGAFTSLRQDVEAMRLEMGAALTEFSDAVQVGKQAIKDIRAEAAEMRAAFAPATNGPED